jgi:methyl-accepting chemotaxis protein
MRRNHARISEEQSCLDNRGRNWNRPGGKAVAEMDKVVQQTAANAEESASASEEMNAQALQMKNNVEQLVTIINGDSNASIGQASYQRIGSEEKPTMEKPSKPMVKKLLTAGTDALKRGKSVRPQEVIPLEKDSFSDF